jgi:hypothetical protein
VCYDRGDPLIVSLTDHDATDSRRVCHRADELELAAKVVWYGWNLWNKIKIPPP